MASPETVDRLATFFLRKFHDAKSESSLAELQCSTQHKFAEIDGTLQKHAKSFDSLAEELRSFVDKAPSFFLHKYSAQLAALSAGRSDANELALERLGQRLDDELKALSEQFADVSTKLAVTTSSLQATLDETAVKTSARDKDVDDRLQACESSANASLARLEALLEANKMDEAKQRQALCDKFLDANKALQTRLDQLERTTARQAELLAAQDKKIKQLEAEARAVAQWRTSQQSEGDSLREMLLEHREKLARVRLPPPSKPAKLPTPMQSDSFHKPRDESPEEIHGPPAILNRKRSPESPDATVPSIRTQTDFATEAPAKRRRTYTNKRPHTSTLDVSSPVKFRHAGDKLFQADPIRTDPVQTHIIRKGSIQADPIRTDPIRKDFVQTESAQKMSRREIAKAFAAHIKSMAREYNLCRPRSERQFIWSFLDGIPDAAWAQYMEEQLLEAYPQWVKPSLGIRAKHAINFGGDMVWKHVFKVIQAMQQKTVPSHLVAEQT